MYEYEYSIEAAGIWTSFDHGTVIAVDDEQAIKLATERLRADFAMANEILSNNHNTKGHKVEFGTSCIRVKRGAYIGRSWIVSWLEESGGGLEIDYNVFDSLESAATFYRDTAPNVHSCTISVVVNSTDYEPINMDEFTRTRKELLG